MSETNSQPSLLHLTARIVAAHAAHNQVTSEALMRLIETVHAALAGIDRPTAPVEETKQQPAVPVKRSVFADHLVCLEDGKKLKLLKRHLMTTFGMTPAQYREKWGLPANYPMVAPDYAARRSQLAKQIGLGRKPDEEPVVKPVARRRGRPPNNRAAAE